MKPPTKKTCLVTMLLPPAPRARLDVICDQRGMTIKSVLSRLVGWFTDLDRTRQSVILGQFEKADEKTVVELLDKRR